MNAWKHCCSKELFTHLIVPMLPKLSLSVKKSGEILCVYYRKLNSITIQETFLLPLIDETLQAVHSGNVFTSFDLVQEYLKFAMAEDDIKKTTFRARVLQACMNLLISILAC